MEEKKCYVCEECDARVLDGGLITSATRMIQTSNEQIRKVWESFHPDEAYDPPPERLYHRVHVYTDWNLTSGTRLCGPLHEETEQEYFVHWVSAGMNSGKRR